MCKRMSRTTCTENELKKHFETNKKSYSFAGITSFLLNAQKLPER